MSKITSILLLSAVMSGCATTIEPSNIRLPSPPDVAHIEQGKEPIFPTPDTAYKDWKYGYFCGDNYPDYGDSHFSREELVKKYYSTKPYDDIDAACRDHDVCWIYFGDGDGECNDQFYDRIDYISESYERWDHPHKCFNVTQDIKFAFLSIFVQYNHTNKAKQSGARAGRLINLLLSPLAYPARKINVEMNGYPSMGIHCNIER